MRTTLTKAKLEQMRNPYKTNGRLKSPERRMKYDGSLTAPKSPSIGTSEIRIAQQLETKWEKTDDEESDEDENDDQADQGKVARSGLKGNTGETFRTSWENRCREFEDIKLSLDEADYLKRMKRVYLKI